MIAIIPARGNSTRFPGKNLALCQGKPLVVLAVECAIASGVFKDVVVSSEDTRVLALATNAGASTILRPEALSAPGVRVPAICFHALTMRDFKPDSFAVLLPTSPLRTPEVLKLMAKTFFLNSWDCLMSFGYKGGLHDGTAIFTKTSRFLEELDFYPMKPVPYFIPDFLRCDVNTPGDLVLAERKASGALI